MQTCAVATADCAFTALYSCCADAREALLAPGSRVLALSSSACSAVGLQWEFLIFIPGPNTHSKQEGLYNQRVRSAGHCIASL